MPIRRGLVGYSKRPANLRGGTPYFTQHELAGTPSQIFPSQNLPMSHVPSLGSPSLLTSNSAPSPVQVLVLILRGESRDSDPHVARLKACFAAEPMFRVKTSKETLLNHNECHIMTQVFKYLAASKYRRLPTLIIKDSSLIRVSPSKLARQISAMLRIANRVDVYYLCVWNDKCNRQKTLYDGTLPPRGNAGTEENIKVAPTAHPHSQRSIADESSTNTLSSLPSLPVSAYSSYSTSSPPLRVHTSIHPTATQAIIYTPRARELVAAKLHTLPPKVHDLGTVLNGMIQERTLLSAVIDPNVVDFDMDLAVTNRDYEKRNRCSTVPILNDQPAADGVTGVIVLLVLIFVFAVMIYIIFRRLAPSPASPPSPPVLAANDNVPTRAPTSRNESSLWQRG